MHGVSFFGTDAMHGVSTGFVPIWKRRHAWRLYWNL